MFGHKLQHRGYFKGGGGETQQSSTVQKADPWSGVQPYLKDLLKRGQSVTNQPYQYYSGDRIAPFSPEQQLGMDLTTQRAMSGSPLLNAGQQNATDTLTGNYMSPDSNPWLRSNVDRAMGDVSSRVNSMFGNDNFGSTAHQELLTRGLGDVASSMYGQNYGQERQNQMNLIPQTPGLSQADYTDPMQLANVGAQRQGLAQQYLDQAYGDYQGAVDWPYTQLQRYGNVAAQGTGSGGTTSSTTTGPNPNQQNPLANILGLGLAGASLFGGLGGLGGLLGLPATGGMMLFD